MVRATIWVLVVLWPALALGCGDDDDDGAGDGGTDADADTDTDTDTDGDTDADTDTGSDTGEPFDPENLIEWVSIAGGSYSMGDGLLPETSPQHQVEVPAFEIARHEVTNEQYGACIEHNLCDELAIDDGDGHPVRGVSYGWARYFCNWVGGSLPSEAQWEYAARNLGATVAYPWGDAVATCDWAVMATVPDAEAFWGCDTGLTFPVCSKTDGNTEQDLCDMAGNVWEWMDDGWHDSYDGAPDDGSAWDPDSASLKVIRGGGLSNNNPAHLLAAFRSYHGYAETSVAVGFRCVREPQE